MKDRLDRIIELLEDEKKDRYYQDIWYRFDVKYHLDDKTTDNYAFDVVFNVLIVLCLVCVLIGIIVFG